MPELFQARQTRGRSVSPARSRQEQDSEDGDPDYDDDDAIKDAPNSEDCSDDEMEASDLSDHMVKAKVPKRKSPVPHASIKGANKSRRLSSNKSSDHSTGDAGQDTRMGTCWPGSCSSALCNTA